MRLIILLVGCLLAIPALAEVDILRYQLRDLASDKTVDLAMHRGAINLLMFFEPECPYCFKQARILSQLQHRCDRIQPIAVGVNGSRQDLRAEMRRMRAEFPALQISVRLHEDLGKVEGTPLLLITDRAGMLVTWLRGLKQEDMLAGLLNQIEPQVCS